MEMLGTTINRLAMANCAAICIIALALPASAGPNCTCRANGKDYREGQIICLKLPSDPQLLRCEQVLNNTS